MATPGAWQEKLGEQANELLRNANEMKKKIDQAVRKAERHKKSLKKVWDELQWFFRLAKAYSSGEYKKIPWKSIVYVFAAILYFLNPFDIVPDFLVGIGFIDDATVIAFVANAVYQELESFKQYWVTRSPS